MSGEEMPVWVNVIRGTVRRGNVCSENCPAEELAFEKLSRKWLRGTVSRRKIRRGNVRRGTVRIPFQLWSTMLWRVFSFDEEDFPPLVPVAFVSKCFYHNLCWYFQLILFSQYAALPKKPANLLYQEERLKIFFWSYKEGLY